MTMRLPLLLAGGVFAAVFFWPAPPSEPATDGAEPPPTVAVRKARPAPDIVLDRKADGHFYATVEVNGRPIRFLVDTGATAIALTADDAHALGFGWTPSELAIVGRGASGEVKGKIVELHHLKLGDKEARNMRAAIIPEGLPVSLLGHSFLRQIGSLQIADDRMILR